MTVSESDIRYSVWIRSQRVGSIVQRGDYSRFTISPEYAENPEREVLSLFFEDDLSVSHASNLRAIPWFSNLLPEGPARDLIAHERGVSAAREMELLAHVGQDLPGAVYLLPDDSAWSVDEGDSSGPVLLSGPLPEDEGSEGRALEWKFSLAGVGIKLSMLTKEARLTMPARGEYGDWIVKLPHQVFSNLPLNEFAIMRLASLVGIETPEIRLVHRDELRLEAKYWRSTEEAAIAVKRFDRGSDGSRVHIEDLAQVRGFYPEDKYSGNYETVASIFFRDRDVESLREFVRRLTLSVVIDNGDAHLKNWSLIYRDQRVPAISPAYDLVSTAPYRDVLDKDEDLALKWANSYLFRRVTISSIEHLEERLNAKDAGLADVARDTVNRIVEFWPQLEADLASADPKVASSIAAAIAEAQRRMLSR